jgi:hypothetical protein
MLRFGVAGIRRTHAIWFRTSEVELSRRSAAIAVCYAFVGFVLRATHGTYHSTLVWSLAAAVAALAWLVLSRRTSPRTKYEASDGTFWLAALVAGQCWLLWLDPMLITAGPTRATQLVHGALLAAAVAMSLYLVVSLRPRREADAQRAGSESYRRLEPRGAGALIAAGYLLIIAARFAALAATPRPQIDVFVTNSLACDYYLDGQNPYSARYPDIYEGTKDYAPGFFYWPAYLTFAAPFHAAFGDIRFAALAADLLTALLLAMIARRAGLSRTAASLLPLAWLTNPVGLMVLELAWVDPVLVMGGALVAAALLYERFTLAAIAVGFTAATKQYGAVVGLFALAQLYATARRSRVEGSSDAWPRLARFVFTSGAVFAAFMLPFVLRDPSSFYRQTIATYLTTSMRLDGLSLVVWAKRTLDIDLPGALLLSIYFALAGGFAWQIARRGSADLRLWAGATAVTYAGVFLLGRLAFCNYYHLASFWMLLTVAFSLAEDCKTVAEPIFAAHAPSRSAAAPTPVAGVVSWSA